MSDRMMVEPVRSPRSQSDFQQTMTGIKVGMSPLLIAFGTVLLVDKPALGHQSLLRIPQQCQAGT